MPRECHDIAVKSEEQKVRRKSLYTQARVKPRLLIYGAALSLNAAPLNSQLCHLSTISMPYVESGTT